MDFNVFPFFSRFLISVPLAPSAQMSDLRKLRHGLRCSCIEFEDLSTTTFGFPLFVSSTFVTFYS